MAQQGSASGNKGKKFAFKKRTGSSSSATSSVDQVAVPKNPPVVLYDIGSDDDDDDDFKLCTTNLFPTSSKATGFSQTVKVPSASTKDPQRSLGAIKGESISDPSKEAVNKPTNVAGFGISSDKESLEVKTGVVPRSKNANKATANNIKKPCQSTSSDQENLDDITFLECVMKTEATCATGDLADPNKGAWKSLMGKMQKNQKDALQNSRNKTSFKRNLTQSPKSRKGAAAASPIKKNPRLATAGTVMQHASTCNTAIRHLKEDDYSDEASQRKLDSTVLKTEKLSLQKTDEGHQAGKEGGSRPASKIAPVFLPASERKALQATVTTACKLDSELLLENLTETSQSISHASYYCDPNLFDGNTVILNRDQPAKDPYEGNKTKICPFYKKLPGVPFCVDAFNYGLIPEMEVYFLSHFHSDHYIGLTKKFCKTLICTHPTGNLVRMKLYVEEKCIRKLLLNEPYIICDSEVTLVDANHCPGSVMFIFRLRNGQVLLHTGDFRYTPSMLTNPSILGLKVDCLYLDTTYCSPEYDFPTQREAISNVILQVKRHLEYRPKTLILCGSYLIGKERVYFTLAEAIGSKVFGNYDKRKIINALENPKFSSLITSDEDTASVHVVNMFSISAKNLQEYLIKKPQFTNIIGIKPSGWQFSSSGTGCSIKSHYNDTVTVIGVPYSEHSSFSELQEFVTNVKPKKVQPTVNVGNTKKRGDMMQHIDNWLSMK